MEKGSKLSRRKFLTSAGIGAAGCGLIVTMPACGTAQAAPASQGGKGPNVKGVVVDINEPTMKNVDLECDVFVAGGGLAGVAAALSAARRGMKVVFCQDRSRLGGNASSEVKMHPLGVHPSVVGFREGGIIEELKLECAAKNPQNSWEIWDLIIYDKVKQEKNITLLLDAPLFRVETAGDKIKTAYVRCDASWHIYKVSAKIFIDCTGDGRMAIEAGCKTMSGRDGVDKYGESNADYDPVGTRMGSSLMFTAKEYETPMPFTAPNWAIKVTPEMLQFRGFGKESFDYGYWWIELGGDKDAIADNENLRFELMKIVMGVWDYIKNSGKYPTSANWALESVGMLPGRRDSFRIDSEYIFKQQDIEGEWKNLKDSVCVGGWSMDDHPKEGFYASDRRPCRQDNRFKYYNIPFGSLISKDMKNLMMAGRNAGVSHVALTSTRVMVTCAAMGQAVGTAAALCVKDGRLPAQLRNDASSMKAFQQALLRDDQTILETANDDPLDLARKAVVKASKSSNGTQPKNVINGVAMEYKPLEKNSVRETKNRWMAPVADKPWIELAWGGAQKISEVQLTFDSGSKQLAITGSAGYRKAMNICPQPETVKDFKLTATLADNSKKVIADVSGNYQRLLRFKFDPMNVKALRLDISATNGDESASLFEIRAYA